MQRFEDSDRIDVAITNTAKKGPRNGNVRNGKSGRIYRVYTLIFLFAYDTVALTFQGGDKPEIGEAKYPPCPERVVCGFTPNIEPFLTLCHAGA